MVFVYFSWWSLSFNSDPPAFPFQCSVLDPDRFLNALEFEIWETFSLILSIFKSGMICVVSGLRK